MDLVVLDTQIIYKSGCFMCVRQWIKGIHPQLGIISKGWTGWETIIEKDVIKPLHTFYVKENNVQENAV